MRLEPLVSIDQRVTVTRLEPGLCDELARLERDLDIHPAVRVADAEALPMQDGAKTAAWLAHDGDRPCAYVRATWDPGVAAQIGENLGFFSHFIARDHIAGASAVLEAASNWLTARGAEKMRGPMTARLSDLRGVLIDGYEQPLCLGLAHNPPYYGELLEAAGLAKAMDLYSYRIRTETLPKVERVAQLARLRQPLLRVRDFDPRNAAWEIPSIVRIYNAAWKDHWSFIPVRESDFRTALTQMRDFFDPQMAKIATLRGREVGLMISVPNILDPRVVETGRPLSARAMMFGVDKGYQKRGIDAVLMRAAVEMAKRKGIEEYEVGWVLESNRHWKRQLEVACGPAILGVRKYRLYERRTMTT